MLRLVRALERHRDRGLKREVNHTFLPPDRAAPLVDDFGVLYALDEVRLPPGTSIPRHPRRDAEGRSGVLQAGEFQRLTSGRQARHRETNASRVDWAHVFQMAVTPREADLPAGHEEQRFSVGQRRGELCVVASGDGRRGSLRLHQDTLIYSALLATGQHLVHDLGGKRAAWLHVVEGEVTLGDLILMSGDGAGIAGERAVSLTANRETEVLLLDVAMPERPIKTMERSGHLD
jgi:redox-sensitive bicupin YhaK (pirin superfamily)